MAEVSSQEAECGVRFFGDVGDVIAPFQIFGEENTKVGVVLDLFEDGVVEGVVEARLHVGTEDEAFVSIKAHSPGVRPCLQLL